MKSHRPKDKRGHPRPEPIKLIVTYKFAKATIEMILAAILFHILFLGGSHALSPETNLSGFPLVSELSLLTAKLFVHATPSKLHYTDLALIVDGMVTLIEGVILYQGFAWASWFVAAATGVPLPLELFHIIRHPRPGRIIFFCVNILVVGYLGRRALRA